jgi:CubicO group peptidase (beta-lactamase class C family)
MNHQLRYGDAHEAGMLPARVQKIREVGAKWVELGQAASLTLLVARRGVVVVHQAFGRLGPEPDAPSLPLDAVYPIASLTKPITATCAMLLVEDGLLGLNRPVQEYIPEFTGDGKDAVMVHHLLTHTGGMTPEGIEAHAAMKMAQGALKPDDDDCPGIGVIPLWGRGDPCLYDVPLAIRPGSEMWYSSLSTSCLPTSLVEWLASRRRRSRRNESSGRSEWSTHPSRASIPHECLDSSGGPTTILSRS